MSRRNTAIVLSVGLIGLFAVSLIRIRPPAHGPLRTTNSSTSVTARAPEPTRIAPGPTATAAPRLHPASPRSVGTRMDPRENDRYRAELARRINAQQKDNDERYARAAALWPHEQRQEPWATERETAVRNAMQTDRIDHLLMDVQCRQTLCRLEISAKDSDTFGAIKRSATFLGEIGGEPAGGMSGLGYDRALVLFVPRIPRAVGR